eukprot:RCo005588
MPRTFALRTLRRATPCSGSWELGGNVVAAMDLAQRILLTDTVLRSEDDIAVIRLFAQESPFYSNLNCRLRNRNHELLKPLFPYLNWLILALLKLPPYRGIVCGVPRSDGRSSLAV